MAYCVSPTRTPLSSLIVAEGIPPIQASLIEKIRRWEYVDVPDGGIPVVIQGDLVMMARTP